MSEFDDLFDDVIDSDGESENADNEFAFDESQFEDKPEEIASEKTEEKQEESNPEDGEGDYVKFEENDYINYLLSAKGVDPHALLYEDEDGTEKTVNFITVKNIQTPNGPVRRTADLTSLQIHKLVGRHVEG